MLSLVKLAAIAATVPVVAIGVAAQAATAAPSISYSSSSVVAAAALPSTKIEGASAKVALFKPAKVTGAPVTGTCTNKKYSVAIINVTKASEQVTLGGKAFGPVLKPNFGFAVCGAKAGSATFSLKGNTKAKLVITIS